MKSLFIDTSNKILTIAVFDNDELLGVETSDIMNEHSKYAVDKMKKVFDKIKLKPNDINRILVVNGPGSFTGVRIGVTIAKTYAWSLNKEVIPISSLYVNALGYSAHDYYVSFLDARRGFVYASIYDKEYKPFLKEQYISIDELNSVINTLDGSVVQIGDVSINDNETKPIVLDLEKIIKYCKNKETVFSHALKPNYLKRVEAEEKLMVENK